MEISLLNKNDYLCSMKKLSIILILVMTIAVACSHGTRQQRLELVDSLTSQSLTDSAWKVFKQIDHNELESEGERMYYNVLMSELFQIAIPLDSFFLNESYDSILNRNINYYQKAKSPRNLVRSYLNKGKYMLENKQQFQQASNYLKLAEDALPLANDVRLSYQTYEALASLNYFSNNKDLAMHYSYQTLRCAEKSKNDHQMTYACNHLVVLYLDRHEQDSVSKYINHSMSILGHMPPKDRAFALCNLAQVYQGSGQMDSAIVYFKKAHSEYPLTAISNHLAQVYYQQGKHALADRLWIKALSNNNLRNQVEVYQSMVDNKYARGDYRGASDAAIKLQTLKDSLVQQMQTAEVQEIQLKYDKEVEHRKLERFMMWSLVIALILIAIFAIGAIYHNRKTNRARERIMRDQVLINDYQHQIEQLEHSDRDASKDIQNLRKKINELQTQQAKDLSEGHSLYQHLVAGESAVTWNKEQLLKFIEYYKVVNLPFILKMESNYTRLSPGNRFFLILQDMGMSDEQMTYILGVSEGALRTTRSRLRQKQTIDTTPM